MEVQIGIRTQLEVVNKVPQFSKLVTSNTSFGEIHPNKHRHRINPRSLTDVSAVEQRRLRIGLRKGTTMVHQFFDHINNFYII